MGIASLARARLAREDGGQGASGLVAGFVDGGAGGQALESGLDSGEVVEGVETVCAAAEFAVGLGLAQHEEAEDGGLFAARVEDGARPMLVLWDTGIASGRHAHE